MIIDDATAARIAERLDEAERTRTATTQISSEYPAMTIEDAYAVQRAWVALKLARGRSVISVIPGCWSYRWAVPCAELVAPLLRRRSVTMLG